MAENVRKLPANERKSLFWRSGAILGSFNYGRQEGLGFLYSMLPSLRRIYGNDPEGFKEACHRHLELFNMSVAPSTFVMGIAVSMEEQAAVDPTFDKSSINALKVSLMGPLSGLGDSIFWGILKVLACSIGASFALQGSILGPIALLLIFNIPNYLTRYYCIDLGYENGAGLLESLQKSGKMSLFTYCAGIVGMAAIGCLVASWIGISSPLQIVIGNSNPIVLQETLDTICPQLLSLLATLGIFALNRKQISQGKIIGIVIVVSFILGLLGIIA